MRRFAPLLLFLLLAALAALALPRGGSAPESALAGRPAPGGMKGPVLVNFFASWCVPCRAEMKALAEVKNVRIVGIAYKDRPEDLAAFLKEEGNPFSAVIEDAEGLAAIDWGVSGVPETFFVDSGGIVRGRIAGPVTAADIAGLRAGDGE